MVLIALEVNRRLRAGSRSASAPGAPGRRDSTT
jgi:hypothetical protein